MDMISPWDSRLCKACLAGLFSHDGFQNAFVTSSDDPGYAYTTTWADIERTSGDADGCNWCGLLAIYRAAAAAKIRAETGAVTSREQVIQVRVCIDSQRKADTARELRLYIDSTKVGTFKVYTSQGDPAADYLGIEDPLGEMTPSIDWNLALQMINDCASHESCAAPAPKPFPTRLIDCTDPDNPRLKVTEQGTNGRYATLSYVWGGPQPSCLTTSNIDQYQQRIPTPLPQTITDDIFATHKLGVQYLWIDAYCILQDSESDKLHEISKMHGIYESSYITLTPEFAYSAADGFLPEHRPVVCLPFFTPGSDRHVGTMFVRHGLEVKAQWESRLLQLRAQASENLLAYEHIDTRAPVHTRAWCFQELTLSPCVLLFCYPEAYFRCRSATTRVVQGIAYKPRPDLTGMRYLFPNETPSADSANPLSQDNRDGLQASWHHIVLEYSERRMTLPEDKLVAVAAVAEAFSLAGAGEYVAGLWRQTLLEDLMWEVIHESESKDPLEYRAPSWSWASTNDQVHMGSLTETQRKTLTDTADIVDCTVVPKSSINPFGAIFSGVLVLQAKMESVLWNPERRCFIEEEGGTRDPDEFRNQYFFLVLASGSADDLGKVWIIGLFVLPSTPEGTYRRVGQPYRTSYIPSWYGTALKRVIRLV